MKIVRTAKGKTQVKMSREEWAKLGKKAGFMNKEAFWPFKKKKKEEAPAQPKEEKIDRYQFVKADPVLGYPGAGRVPSLEHVKDEGWTLDGKPLDTINKRYQKDIMTIKNESGYSSWQQIAKASQDIREIQKLLSDYAKAWQQEGGAMSVYSMYGDDYADKAIITALSAYLDKLDPRRMMSLIRNQGGDNESHEVPVRVITQDFANKWREATGHELPSTYMVEETIQKHPTFKNYTHALQYNNQGAYEHARSVAKGKVKITKTAAGKKSITMSKSQWESIGKKTGWLK